MTNVTDRAIPVEQNDQEQIIRDIVLQENAKEQNTCIYAGFSAPDAQARSATHVVDDRHGCITGGHYISLDGIRKMCF